MVCAWWARFLGSEARGFQPRAARCTVRPQCRQTDDSGSGSGQSGRPRRQPCALQISALRAGGLRRCTARGGALLPRRGCTVAGIAAVAALRVGIDFRRLTIPPAASAMCVIDVGARMVAVCSSPRATCPTVCSSSAWWLLVTSRRSPRSAAQTRTDTGAGAGREGRPICRSQIDITAADGCGSARHCCTIARPVHRVRLRWLTTLLPLRFLAARVLGLSTPTGHEDGGVCQGAPRSGCPRCRSRVHQGCH